MGCTPFPGWFCVDPTSVLEFRDGSVQIHGLCSIPRVDFYGFNFSAGIPGWFCARSMVCAGIPGWFCADPWSVLHSQSGFLWIQPLCWNSRLVLYQIHGLAPFPGWISLDPTSLLEFQGGSVQTHGLYSIPRVDFYGSNLSAGIPGWFCARSMVCAGIPGWISLDPTSLLEFQGGSVQIHGLCSIPRVDFYGSNLSTGIPGWFCARSMVYAGIPGWISLDPTSLLEFQDGSVQIHGLCSIPRVDFYGSNLCAGIPGWFCADPAAPAGSAKHYTTFPKENPCFPGPSQAPTNSINPGPGALKPDLNPGGSSSVLARTGGRLCK
ncbi:uncharacterized protein LOC113954911 isoform X4 [Corapipo altera]|uniref:uncharacterized protein LOC113954911 isoform X4 n=1 Tax=Corapipo altera TaxID=415028 RepID=UPI000FD6481A|nr:uncharacterized protein LOC113954911 isoform X4 [Corapipo altera]